MLVCVQKVKYVKSTGLKEDNFSCICYSRQLNASEVTCFCLIFQETQGFPGDLEGKASACNVGDPGSVPESGRSPGEGNGNPLQYSCLENPMDGGAWEAAVHGVAMSRT